MTYNPYQQYNQFGQAFPPVYNSPYQQQIPQNQQMQMQPQSQQMFSPAPIQETTDDRIWVQGESGAKAYIVARGATVTLWDSESPIIYIKSTDLNGKPDMITIDLTYRNQQQNQAQMQNNGFVTREEYEYICKKIEDLEGRFTSPQKRKSKNEEELTNV